jgi:RimJ/RimL family protein N-acetyltransferase
MNSTTGTSPHPAPPRTARPPEQLVEPRVVETVERSRRTVVARPEQREGFMAAHRRVRSPRVLHTRYQIEWVTPAGRLVAIEPEPDEIAGHLATLTAAYNDPHNAPLLGHESLLDEQEVLDHYESLLDEGARSFLLFHDGELAGDGDLRHLRDGACEFAFLIAAVGAQGKGLGTRFATMVHSFGFGPLQLLRIYASIVPANVASRRVFEKLGYAVDDSATARSFADAPGDIVMSIDRATFERQHAARLGEIQIAPRLPRLDVDQDIALDP